MSTLNSNALVDGNAYQQPEDIRALLARLRAENPVSYVSPDDHRPFWAVTKYRDIKHVEMSPELFSTEPRTVILPEMMEQKNLEKFGDIHGVKTLVHMDGDLHRKLRGVTMNWFMPKNIVSLKEEINRIAIEFVAGLEKFSGECDFAEDVAFWYPLRVVLQLIGIPENDEANILRLTQRLFAPAAYIEEGKDATAVYGETVQEMVSYFTSLAESRRQSPKNDLASILASAEVDGQPLDPFALTSYFVLLATAGHDTTSASLAGGLQALVDYPDQWELLVAQPELFPKFVDEVIRWVTPVKHFVRTALVDTELSGVAIPKGDSVALFFESGNRDADFFSEPNRFDIRRENNKHIAFGFGRHNCLGSHLAKVELECFFRHLLPRLKSVEVSAQPEYMASHFVSGLKSFPIRYQFVK